MRESPAASASRPFGAGTASGTLSFVTTRCAMRIVRITLTRRRKDHPRRAGSNSMSQLTRRRIGLALGLWRLLRYQSSLCRYFPVVQRQRDPAGVAATARWLGLVRVGNRSHHALLCPPSAEFTCRLLAAPRSRVEAWCGFLPGGSVRSRRTVEFVITARVEGLARPLTRRLRLDPARSRGRRALAQACSRARQRRAADDCSDAVDRTARRRSRR